MLHHQTMVRLLLIDDDPHQQEDIEMIREPSWHLSVARTGREGIERARALEPDVILLDLNLPDMSGIRVLEHLETRRVPVVMLTAYGDTRLVVDAVRAGAFDYVVKGPDFGPILDALRRAINAAAFRTIAATPSCESELSRIVGVGREARRIREQVAAYARSDAPVCIMGESGTGKELVAEAIHRLSARRSGPFVALNTGAIPEQLAETELFGSEHGAYTDARARAGSFERAHGGSLFLDEIGEMTPATQVKLLRAVETKRVRRVGGEAETPLDVRIMAATNRDLKAAVAERRFREDLFYRIGVLVVRVAPLRERPEDVPVLAAHFLARISPPGQTTVLSPAATERLMEHTWPGNIRELRNVMERAMTYPCPDTAGLRVLSAESIDLL